MRPIFFSFPQLPQSCTQLIGDARPSLLGSLDTSVYPFFSLSSASSPFKTVDQAHITSCFRCLALAQRNDLFLAASLFQCFDEPVAKAVTAGGSRKTLPPPRPCGLAQAPSRPRL